MSEAEQYWEQGTSALESDPDHAVQLMLKAIALLDRGLKRSESAAGKRIKERHKLNSAYGGKVKATRFDGVKDEVIKHWKRNLRAGKLKPMPSTQLLKR